ncbi:uncharacterized protein LOC26527336 [Drosophila mojavensis]|uniref:uncharacterized protein LOC26527336 n=1 Tax=Drosophila mojavensis TaxID=7230 RepID=UPI001CD163AD|nr:uncharacterized protein LOC26527336 [Drosophila mojavensis]
MKSFKIILFAVLGLMLFVDARRFRSTTYKMLPWKPITTPKPIVMNLSKDLSRAQRIELSDHCKASGMECRIAEECCNLKCAIANHKCIELLNPDDILAPNIYGI